VPILTRSAGAEAELMKALYDERAPVLWCYARRPKRQSDPCRNLLQKKVLRVQQHPDVIGDTERSARAWLFTVARKINHPREPHRTGPR
jgi:RNA polymerase sigma-70 factor (ECF subfamily)